MEQMISTSLANDKSSFARRCPMEACTFATESSTVTFCGPEACRSRSVRAFTGRIRDFSPGQVCEPFGFVDRCTVSSLFAMPFSASSVSDMTRTKLPPSDMKNLVFPSRIACPDATESNPCSRGVENPK